MKNTEFSKNSKYSNDTLLIADFGRSAQGWLSYMLCYILNARFIEPYDLLKGTQYTNFKVIKYNTNGSLLEREKSSINLVVKTHNSPSSNFNLTEFVVFLTRDPRDVAVSYYYMSKNRLKSGDYSLSNILHCTPFFGSLWIAYRWKRHYNSWIHIDAFRVRYEDIRFDTLGIITSILNNFNLTYSTLIIEEAIELMSFENTYGRKRGEEDKTNSEARKGLIGDYKTKLSFFTRFFIWIILRKQALHAGYKMDGSTTLEPN
jgi:hypothetical protein